MAKVLKTLSMALGHLWQDFCLIPKTSKKMKNETNFVPLAEMLNGEGISHGELSILFDELAHDYARTVIELQMADLSPRSVLHENTDLFLHLLRELRDVFKLCSY
ncbi:hypothetical protein AGMMS50239_37240 [Bacteroidia bacterium]|nr:hypothetical protein AGMMS50239_37240 [Bacteroidia bacterium]